MILKKYFYRFLFKFIRHFLKIVRYYLKNNPEDLKAILVNFREDIIKDSETYPSIINNGYRHIEKSIEIAKFLKLDLIDSTTIIDVGAANGVISKMFCNEFNNAKIYAFEPVKHTFKKLLENVKGIEQIVPINKALGNITGEANINLVNRITSSSLLSIQKKIDNDFFSAHLKKKGEETISAAKLDGEIPSKAQVIIIKIDVQGFELEVLKGGINTLHRTKLIVLEMMNHDLYQGVPEYYVIDEYLRSINFSLFDMIPSIRQNKKLYEWDAIYLNNVLV
ncbi:MAG: FkbM family methyltransferase [Cytophagales bacterium]|nr:FkbM family methyltransferase [Cytophagales bacterium]